MSNETKRDVFNDLVEQHQNYVITVVGDCGVKDKAIEGWNKRYSAALPDDLPVIPKAVGDVLAKLNHKKFSLSGAKSYAEVVSLSSWMTFEHEEDFARAWLLGVWRVEETGEIVKLEEEK